MTAAGDCTSDIPLMIPYSFICIARENMGHCFFITDGRSLNCGWPMVKGEKGKIPGIRAPAVMKNRTAKSRMDGLVWGGRT